MLHDRPVALLVEPRHLRMRCLHDASRDGGRGWGCNNSSSDGGAWVRCANMASRACAANSPGCADGGHLVNDCMVGPTALGIATPLMSCPGGTSSVPLCSSGATPEESGDSGGGEGTEDSGGPPNPNACTENGDCAPCGYCEYGNCITCELDLYGNCPC